MNDEQTTQQEKPRSFPEAVLTKEQWGQVERACVAGMPYSEAAKVFQVTQEAIRQRAFRGQWLTPIKIEKMKQAQAVTQLSQQGAKIEKRPETALEAVAESMEGYKSRTMLGLLKLAEKGVSRAMSADLPVENWQDAKLVADIAMKLHQVGQEGVQVNVLVGGDSSLNEGNTYDLENFPDNDEGEGVLDY